MSFWLPTETAPKDGTIIWGRYDHGRCLIRWSQRPVCMLGSVQGGYPPGWATAGDETDNNLPMDPPDAWKHVKPIYRPPNPPGRGI